MDLTKIVYEYEINEENYIMCFDMRSIATFKDLTGSSFLKSSALIGELDDEIILNFLAASLRKAHTPDEPLGRDLFNFNIMTLLFTFHNDVLEMVVNSMPQGNGETVKKKLK